MAKDKSHMFSEERPTLQVAWDATSLKELMFCPRRYQYTIVQGWRSRGESMHLTFGSWYHEALEVFDRLRAGDFITGPALEEAVFNTVNELSHGWDEQNSQKNRFTLIRSVMWYIYNYEKDEVKVSLIGPGESPAVELSFMFDSGLEAMTGEPYQFCGHMDGVCEFDGTYYVRERKTTGKTLNNSFFETFLSDCQIEMYSLAGEVVTKQPIEGVMIDACQVAVNFSRYGRYVVKKNKSQKSEFLHDVSTALSVNELYADQNYWPKHTRNCWFCEFRAVCGQTPEVQQSILEAEYKTYRWDPTDAR